MNCKKCEQDIQVALGKAIVYANNDEPNNFDSRFRYKLTELGFKIEDLISLVPTHKQRVARSTLKRGLATRLGVKLKDKSIEEKLASVGLTIKQVMTYAYKQAEKEINKNFNPVDDSMKPYRFKKPQQVISRYLYFVSIGLQ